MPKDPIDGETVATRGAALKIAKTLGCDGAHNTDAGWVPCESREALLILIREGKAGYEAYQKRQKRKTLQQKSKARRTVITPLTEGEDGRKKYRRKYRQGERGLPSPRILKKKHDLVFYTNSTMPQVIEKDAHASPTTDSGAILERRPALDYEEKMIAKGLWQVSA